MLDKYSTNWATSPAHRWGNWVWETFSNRSTNTTVMYHHSPSQGSTAWWFSLVFCHSLSLSFLSLFSLWGLLRPCYYSPICVPHKSTLDSLLAQVYQLHHVWGSINHFFHALSFPRHASKAQYKVCRVLNTLFRQEACDQCLAVPLSLRLSLITELRLWHPDLSVKVVPHLSVTSLDRLGMMTL